MVTSPVDSSRSTRTILLLVLLALAIRVAVIPFLVGEMLSPARDHWEFGWEEGRIARSIAAGEGFSSPLFGKTGATSWTTPVYPYLLAGVFRLFGIYTGASAWVILTLNALFSALTCIPVYFIARRSFGPAPALWAGWIWALFPYSIYLASGRIWGHSIDTLMMALVLWCTLAIEEQAGIARWIGYGFLWGLAALTNAVILSTLPFLLGWLIWRRTQRGMGWHFSVSAAILSLALTVTPWFVRNYLAFGRFIPFRGVFWMALWQGNTGDASDRVPDWANPSQNDTELEKYRQQGEVGYVAGKRVAFLDSLKHNPTLLLWFTVKRVIFTWTGFWSFDRAYLAREPFEIPNIAFCSTLTILMAAGLRRAYQINREAIVPLVVVLVAFPGVYYITYSGMDYRHPIDTVLAVFLGVLGCNLAKSRASATSPAKPKEI